MTIPVQDYSRGRRNSARRTFGYPARLQFAGDAQPIACVIADISETGAQLQLLEAADIPNEFVLLIGGHADVQRRCRLIWRSRNKIGVRFQGLLQRRTRR
jgi:PilZ domain-containing protein